MNGRFYVDTQGRKIYEGEYVKQDICTVKSGTEGIVKLYQNHACCCEEILNMVRWICILKDILGMKDSNGYSEKQISDAEKRIGQELPKELKEFYHCLNREDLAFFIKKGDKKKDHYLPLEEIYLDGECFVFRMRGIRKKTSIGLGSRDRRLMIKEKEWIYEPYMESFCELVIEHLAICAIENMNFCASVRIKGREISDLHACRLLEKKYQEYFLRFDGYYNLYNSVMYRNETGTVAWLRTNGFMADIKIGTNTREVIESFEREQNGTLKWRE